MLLKDIKREEYWLPGNASCPGCGLSLGLRLMTKAIEKPIVVIPASCASVVQGTWPKSSASFPLLNIAMAGAGAAASGISNALEALNKEGTVVAWAGDGGTADIGLQSLSGAAERGDNIIFIMYDNEAYMNTGIQRSSSTPHAAWTTTTPEGKREFKKDIAAIMMVHNIEYVATASISFPTDFIDKLKKAETHKGTKFIQLYSPCPPGWRIDTSDTIEVGKLAVQTGLWILYEYENNKLSISQFSKPFEDKSKRRPINDYLKLQGRFSRISEDDIKEIEAAIDEKWHFLQKLK
ncbi:MAG: 3-methyl-2-oxobutanoate dehydrogenase subunit beta [Candidatus Micrarchaeaceae archaeon]